MFYCSELSGADTAKSVSQSVGYANSFAFKLEDLNGRVHRFNCGELTALVKHCEVFKSPFSLALRLDANTVHTFYLNLGRVIFIIFPTSLILMRIYNDCVAAFFRY